MLTWLAAKVAAIRGWRFTGELPDLAKVIVIGAPHTSNWDFVIYLAAVRHYRMKSSFMGKHTLFRWPLGYFFRRWGGIPVDRTQPGGVVAQVVRAFESAEEMTLVIAPEGTRKAAPHWKSGFLQIAAATGAPVVLGYVDYPSRRAGMGPMLHFDGDTGAFMDRAREFYADKEGLHPEGKGPVRLSDEERFTIL